MRFPQVGFLVFISSYLLGTAIATSPPATNQVPVRSPNTNTNNEIILTQSQNLSSIIASSPLLSFHRALCEIESISNNELAVAELLVSYLKAHNFTVTTQKVPQPPDSDIRHQERWNVFAVPDASRFPSSLDSGSASKHGPKVILTSHIDTVPPFIPYSLYYPYASHTDISSFNRSTLQILGRGTVDAKACVATQTHALLSLLSQQLLAPSDAALLFVVGEEASGSGMRTFSDSTLNKNLKYSAVIFGEPTELKLASGHKGITMVTINAHGKAAHSGYPWLGVNANSAILPALTVLDLLGNLPEEDGGLPRSEKYGRSTVNIGLMRGGVAGNVIPESAFAKVTFRLAGGTRDEVVKIVTKALKNDEIDPDDVLDLDFSQGYGPVDLDAGVEGFGEITVNYGTDVPNLEQREGVKRYLYGPGSILVAHGKDEGLTVGDLEEAVKGYERLILNALRKA